MTVLGQGYSFGPYVIRDLEDARRAIQDIAKGLAKLGRQNFQYPSPGWVDPSNYTETKTFDANSTSTAELADVLATLIIELKKGGILRGG